MSESRFSNSETFLSGSISPLNAPNRQFANFDKIDEFNGEIEPERKVSELENLLSLKLSPELKHYLYEQIFKAAEKVKEYRRASQIR